MFTTNLKVYMSVLLLVVAIGLGFNTFTNELSESAYVNISTESMNYLNQLNGLSSENGLDDYSDYTSVDEKNLTRNFFSSDEGKSIAQDAFANLNFFRKIGDVLWKPLSFVFGVPSFLMYMVGLPLSPFSFIAAVLNTSFFVGLIMLIIREILK